VTLLQLWLFVGIPALALALALFVGRSRWRSLAGYVVLIVGFGVMVVFDRASAAVFGGLLALVYASGRGGDSELEGFDLTSATGVSAAEAAERLTHGDASAAGHERDQTPTPAG
jgi:hypothetical protein